MEKFPVKPNFFIIGAPKSGTTALSEYLRQHPNVFFSNPKEPEYFANDFEGRVISKENDYLKLFKDVEINHHLAIGEGSVLYMFSKNAVSTILQFQNTAKFIVMLRNPVDLVVSLHAQLLKEGNENIYSFSEAWKAEADRYNGKRIPISCRDPKWLLYSEWGKLGSQLKRVINIVPEKQLKIILFDDFISNTKSVFKEILEFLKIPEVIPDKFPKINERRLPKNLFLQNLIAVVMRIWLPLRSKLTGGKGFGIGGFLSKLNSTNATEKISLEEHQMLVEFYSGEILLLEKLLNRNLSSWRE